MQTEASLSLTRRPKGSTPDSLPLPRPNPVLADLGITKSHNRPYTSNDNPYSEAQIKTLKYHPSFPDRFGSQAHARAFCQHFFGWYNTEHRHSSLALLSPANVHYGRGEQILAQRTEVLREAFEAHPQRFKGRVPSPGKLPEAVWINPPKEPLPLSSTHRNSETGSAERHEVEDGPPGSESESLVGRPPSSSPKQPGTPRRGH